MKHSLPKKILSMCLCAFVLMLSISSLAEVTPASDPPPLPASLPIMGEQISSPDMVVDDPDVSPSIMLEGTDNPDGNPVVINEMADDPAGAETLVPPETVAEPEVSRTAEMEAYFGLDSGVIMEYETFYEALFSYSLMRAGGMPMTIGITASQSATFSGAVHSAAFTEGSITTAVPLPPYMTVTFEAVAEGRIPGVYNASLVGATVFDTMNNIDMTRFFEIQATGGTLEITSAGSLLMISTDDAELVFNGLTQTAEVTTGSAYANWQPLSSDLRLVVTATGSCAAGANDMVLEDYAIEVIADNTDITEYYENVFASSGTLRILPPEEPILVCIHTARREVPYNGRYQTIQVENAELRFDDWPNYAPVSDELQFVYELYYESVLAIEALINYQDEKASMQIKAADGTDITDYFEITPYGSGTLVVTQPETPIPVTIKVHDATAEYSGVEQRVYSPGATIYLDNEVADWLSIGGLSPSYNYRVWGAGTEPGTYPLGEVERLGIHGIWNGDWLTLTSFHDITLVPGTLTIN